MGFKKEEIERRSGNVKVATRSKEMGKEERETKEGYQVTWKRERKNDDIPLMCAIFHLFPGTCFSSSLHMLFCSLLVKSLAL